MRKSGGSTVSNVKITLEDSNNAGVPNDNITITSSNPNVRFNSNTNIQTQLDGNGIFRFNMTSTDGGDINVTILDRDTNTTFSNGIVHFDSPGSPTSTPTPTPTPQPGTCTDASPGSTVQLMSATSAGAHSIRLVWTDASNPVTNYVLSYGLSSGNYIYGNPDVGGLGTTSYTVGGLTTGTRYYFVVMADNGCTAGNYSNEMSEVAGGAPTPTDTPTPTPLAEPDPAPQETDTTTPTEVPSPTPTIVPAKSNSFVSHIMVGATVVGVICAGIGIFVFLKMKKKQ